MFKGKRKAVTFSYDDGITQDIRLIEMFDKYGLKATFNLNSGTLGKDGQVDVSGKKVSHKKVDPLDVAKIYKGYEVAAHTLTHPFLTRLKDSEVIKEVEEDRKELSRLCGYNVVGMAYPYGHDNDHIIDLIKKNTGIKYSRTVTPTYGFEKQNNLLRFNPTLHHNEFDKMFELANKFLNDKGDNELLFYIWGHSYEFDAFETWDKFESFCKLISGHDDVFYGTNSEVLLP